MFPRFLLMNLIMTGSLVAIVCGDELVDAKAALEKAGVRVLSTGLAVPNEGDLAKELGRSTLLRRNVNQAQKDLETAQQQANLAQHALTQLRQQHIQLSAQLANVGPNDVVLNNNLVGALNALAGQFELGQKRSAQLDDQVKNTRAKATQAKEAYIQFVVDRRKVADQIEADYAAKAANPEIKAALASFNKSAGKQFTLVPSSSFQAAERRLKQLEETVLAESIDLRDDGSSTFHVSVVVNGKYQKEMVLDSGASLISLPPGIATEFGLKPTDKDRKIILQLADGREIEGRLMKLASVRIGKFTVENVECAVLGNDAANAPPLLGMSFLEKFKFEVDAAAKKLTLVKIAGSDTPAPRAAK